MSRVGHRQLQQLGSRLSSRDWGVLTSIRDFRLMSVDQLRRLHFSDHASEASSSRVCRRVLERLAASGLVARLERRIGGIRAGSSGHVYTLSPLGHRLLGSGTRKRLGEPGLAFVQHTLAVAELAVGLMGTSEVEILDLQPEPNAWRSFSDALIQATLKPDLFVRLGTEDEELSWFVEVDCGTESAPTIQRKCQAYVRYHRSGVEQHRHGVFPRTLWVGPTERRVLQLRKAIQSDPRLDPRLFTVATSKHAVAVLTGLMQAEEP